MTANGNSTALREVVRSVLLVARLGEADRRNWWGTQSFGAAGRVVLKQRLPSTWRMAAVELDVAAARNRHDEIIERTNAVHLFSDNWPVRRWASAWLAEQKTADPPDELLAQLEVIAEEQIGDLLRVPGVKAVISSKAVRVGAVHRDALGSVEELASSVRTLASVYADMNPFAVPYLEVVA